jgi:hypothetical protein
MHLIIFADRSDHATQWCCELGAAELDCGFSVDNERIFPTWSFRRNYGRYYRSALYPTMRELNRDLALWAKRKYKKLRSHLRKAKQWIARISRRAPALFAHWQMGARRGSMMGAV